MTKKYSSRQRAKTRIRKRISGDNERPRLSVFRSDKFTYAQAISDVTNKTLIGMSTKDEAVAAILKGLSTEKAKNPSKSTKSTLAARALGLAIGKQIIEKGISQVIFDRNGFLYHGRVQAVADGAREAGLKF